MTPCKTCGEPAESADRLCSLCAEVAAIESEHVEGEHDKRLRSDCFLCVRRVHNL